jgi:orotate phosphoribosyltransferase-like protein
MACVSHLEKVLSPKLRKKTISNCLEILQLHTKSFNTIAVSGYSQCLIGIPVADKLNKNIVVIRKGGEERASLNLVEGYIKGNFIIIDDLICTGATLKRIIKRMSTTFSTSKCHAIYLYSPEDGVIRTQQDLNKHCTYNNLPKVKLYNES